MSPSIKLPRLDDLAVQRQAVSARSKLSARIAGTASHAGRDAPRLIKEGQRNPPPGGGGEAGPHAGSAGAGRRPKPERTASATLGDRSGGKWWVADRLQRLLWWSKKNEWQGDKTARVPAIGFCGQRAFAGTMSLHRETDGRVWADGLARCGSPRCVLCAGSVAKRRSQYLAIALAEARAKGMKIGFVTLTASHRPQDLLADLRHDLTKALAKVRNGEPWKRIMAKTKTVGSLRWWESTWGQGTGWHLHCHMLVFVEADGDLPEVCNEIIDRWRKKAGEWGKVTSREAQDWVEVGAKKTATAKKPEAVDYEDDDKKVSDYPTGDLVLGLSYEAAGEWTKTGKRPGRMSPGQLASLAAVGDKVCQDKYLELVESLRGLRGLTVDRRLSHALSLGPEPVDEDAADDPDGEAAGDDAEAEASGLTVPAQAWAALVSRQKRGEALAAAGADWKAAPAALTSLSGVQVDPPPVVPGVQGMKPDHDAADAAEGMGAYAPMPADRGGGSAARQAHDPETGEVLPVIAAG